MYELDCRPRRPLARGGDAQAVLAAEHRAALRSLALAPAVPDVDVRGKLSHVGVAVGRDLAVGLEHVGCIRRAPSRRLVMISSGVLSRTLRACSSPESRLTEREAVVVHRRLPARRHRRGRDRVSSRPACRSPNCFPPWSPYTPGNGRQTHQGLADRVAWLPPECSRSAKSAIRYQ